MVKRSLRDLVMADDTLVPGETFAWYMVREDFLESCWADDGLRAESESYDETRVGEMENGMTVGERIRALRKENSLTQETLAEALDVSRQAVAKWESGKSSPSTANLVKMAELFNVSFTELIPENEELSTKEQLDDIRQSIVRLEMEARERRVYFERAKELAVSGLAAAGGFAAQILLVRTLLSFPSVPDYVLSWTLDNHILPARLPMRL